LTKFDRLRAAKNVVDLAPLLGFTPSGLAYVLYKVKPETLYTSFEVPKKSGGVRRIHAPKPMLKLLQRRLADLLTLCLRDIEAKHPFERLYRTAFKKIARSLRMHRTIADAAMFSISILRISLVLSISGEYAATSSMTKSSA
jgi:hypothetical protein